MKKSHIKITLGALLLLTVFAARGAHAQYNYNYNTPAAAPASQPQPATPAPVSEPTMQQTAPAYQVVPTQVPVIDNTNTATPVSDPGIPSTVSLPSTGAGGDIAFNLLFNAALVTLATGAVILARTSQRKTAKVVVK